MKEVPKRKITRLFLEVGSSYKRRGVVSEVDVHQGHDVHAFYTLVAEPAEPSRVIHLQGCPGLSSPEQALIYGRSLDYDKMMEIRRGGISKGSEHGATVQLFPNGNGIKIPYNAKALEDLLAENVPQLR